MPSGEVTEAYIEIWDVKEGNAVVTVIEFVSGTNKWNRVGRREYLQKQSEVLASDANLVEIDLLRGGRSVTAASRADPSAPRRSATYHACVSRAFRREVLEYYALLLREPLPSIPVPLRPDDVDVTLDLQAIVDTTYERGRYEDLLDYTKQPDPPLNTDDLSWASAQSATWKR